MRHLSLLLPLLLAGCAGQPVGSGAILIETVAQGQPLEGVACTVYSNSRSWNITTPEPIAINRMEGDLRMVCNRPGYRTSELILQPTGPSGSSLGVGVGGGSGNVGLGVGFGVPLDSGRWSYPGRVTIRMNPA